MAGNTGYLNINNKDIVAIIKEETADKAVKSDVDSALAGKQPVGDYATKTEVTQGLASKLDTNKAFTQAAADGLYLGKTAKAESAKVADSATKATQDAAGNVIATTYATQTSVAQGLASKLDTSAAFTQATADGLYLGKMAKAESAKTADSVAGANVSGAVANATNAANVPWTGVSGRPDPIPKSGDAGTITTMETIAAAATVNDTSARSMTLANGGTIQVQAGSANKAWITVVALQGSATFNFASGWSWSGAAPTLAKGLVVLAWYGAFGVASFQKFGE